MNALNSTVAKLGGRATLVLEPFLQSTNSKIYNPLSDQTLLPDGEHFDIVQELLKRPEQLATISLDVLSALETEGWVVSASQNLGARYRLKYAMIEGSSVCNQSCYFCPVSVDRRDAAEMSLELYEQIAMQLSEFKETLQAVCLEHYNEPTVDRYFIERVSILKKHGLKPAMNTNATGLTKKRVDQIVELGGFEFLSINLSTVDEQKYESDRGGDHLKLVLRNIEYARNKPVAKQMRIVVIGDGGEQHIKEFESISALVENSNFTVKHAQVMNRAGHVSIGLKPAEKLAKLNGCENVGSRIAQWLHINYAGKAVLCCQDYHASYELGDLTKQSVNDVLSSEVFARIRRWSYGLEEAPADFLCRGCVYACSR